MPSFDYSAFLTQAAADARYQALGSLGSATPTAETPDHAGSAGVSSSASRQDHVHPITAATASGLTNTSANSEGAATSFARSDHSHAITWNVPACRVFNSVGLTHTSTANWQFLSGLDSERFDTDNMHSTSVNTGRITINTAGLYVLQGCIEFAANATGIRGIRFATGGNINTGDIAAQYWPNNGAAIGVALALSTTWKFAAGDFVELGAYQNSGGNLAIQRLDLASPEFSATWIGVG